MNLADHYLLHECLHVSSLSMKDQPHYTITILGHLREEQFEVVLSDLPFSSRKYEIRVNGQIPSRMRSATKTDIWDRLRKWMVKRG